MASSEEDSLAESDAPNVTPVGRLAFCDSRKPLHQEPIDLFPRKILRVGRDERINDCIIGADEQSPVSRAQCEFYVVVYEPGVNHIYVRDRKSRNGTYVNAIKIGSAPEVSSGYLLQDGDVVRVPPYWTFRLSQTSYSPIHWFTPNQAEECATFKHKYVITDRCLGKGAEAAVYLAESTETKRQLVCKIIALDEASAANTPEWRRMKQHEIRVLRKLQHPNILPYVDAIVSSRTIYLFTELAAGGDLMSLITDRGDVLEFEAKVVIRQIVQGLAYLHRKGIIHRDLKPENVLLAYSPKIAYHRVMLADFGHSALPARNRMITCVGTARYHAPERRRGQMQSPAADMWSLGIIALHLLFPESLRDTAELQDLDQHGLDACLSRDVFRGSMVSEAGKEFVYRCLRAKPHERLAAKEAESHAWFRASDKEIRFFEKADSKLDVARATGRRERPVPMQIRT